MSASRLEQIRARLAVEDPDLLAAAEEVDRDLIEWFLTLSPEERLRRAASMDADLQELRRGLVTRDEDQ